MKQTAAPDLQTVPFASNGTKTAITATTSTGSNNASYDVGFPDITMLLKSAGGLPPLGGNFNQILYELSAASQYLSAGAGYAYDSTFSTGISGYPIGALIRSSDFSGFWLNGTDENTVNPENSDGTATGWTPIPVEGFTSITGLAATSVTLTALQAAKPCIILNGVLTANIQVILPPWVYKWDITNNCTGSFSVTVKTTSGTGVVVPGLCTTAVYGDGTNINYDTTSRWLPGTPAAPTATAGTSTTQLATTAFVGNAITAATGRLIKYTVFTDSGTFTPQSTTKSVIVEVQGGGGAGGGTAATSSSQQAVASGGSAGGYAKYYALISALSSTVAVTVGSAGTGVSAGTGGRGGTSAFGSYVSATGGYGGIAGSASSGSAYVLQPNAGGTATGGNIVSCGGSPGGSATFVDFDAGTSGFGGASATFGGGGLPGSVSGAGNTAATGYGSGGGGGISGISSSAQSGKNGYKGIVIVWEYA